MTIAHEAFVKRRTRRGVAELKEQFDRFLRVNSPFPNRLSRPNRSFQYHPSTPKEAFMQYECMPIPEPRAHVIYDNWDKPSDPELDMGSTTGTWADLSLSTRYPGRLCTPTLRTEPDPPCPKGYFKDMATQALRSFEKMYG